MLICLPVTRSVSSSATRDDTRPRKVRKRRLLAFGLASPLVLYLAPMSVRVAFGGLALRYLVADFVITMAMTIVVFTAMWRTLKWSLRRRHSTRLTLVYAFLASSTAMMPVGLVRYALTQEWPTLLQKDPFEPDSVGFVLASSVSDSLPLLVLWSGLFLLPVALRRAERHRAQVTRVRRDAELFRLRAALEPHFVLNTLNTIAGLAADEPLEARRLIGLLGDLFRDATLDRDGTSHALEAEMSWLGRYAAIHEARHRRMVKFVWEIDPAAESVHVPPLLLQPLVENAVLHGVLRRRGGGTIWIRARIEDAELVCEVEDDGPGFSEGPLRAGARGIRLVERRLALGTARGQLLRERVDERTRLTIRIQPDAVGAT